MPKYLQVSKLTYIGFLESKLEINSIVVLQLKHECEITLKHLNSSDGEIVLDALSSRPLFSLKYDDYFTFDFWFFMSVVNLFMEIFVSSVKLPENWLKSFESDNFPQIPNSDGHIDSVLAGKIFGILQKGFGDRVSKIGFNDSPVFHVN